MNIYPKKLILHIVLANILTLVVVVGIVLAIAFYLDSRKESTHDVYRSKIDTSIKLNSYQSFNNSEFMKFKINFTNNIDKESETKIYLVHNHKIIDSTTFDTRIKYYSNVISEDEKIPKTKVQHLDTTGILSFDHSPNQNDTGYTLLLGQSMMHVTKEEFESKSL